MLGLIIGILYFVGLPAAIAWILGGALDKLFPAWSFRLRTVLAAFAAGFLPMALPLVAVLVGDTLNNGESQMVPVLALVFMALLLSLLIGLPVALYTRRAASEPNVAPGTFD